jgi:CAI-1 autoinducer synthase
MQVLDVKQVTTPSEPPLGLALQRRIDTEFVPRWHSQWGGKFVLHGSPPGPDAIRLDGNDYLGISGHPDIVQAQVNALRCDHESVIQSGVFLLGEHPVRKLEAELAALVGKQDGLICQSGYAANIGLLQAIADPKTPVYLDALAHASLWEGAHAARAPIHAFRHNDPQHLQRLIAQHGPGLVVVDSVYSTTGAACRLVDILDVCEANACMILVDESHSLGTHGPHGAGFCAMHGLAHRVHFITASLAKAFAGRAGFITFPAQLRYYVLSTSFPTIFSSCLLPHEVAGLMATLEVVRRSDGARQRLHAITRRVRRAVADLGYPIHQGTEQIIALEAGSEPATMALRDALEGQGIFGAIFCAPATSRNRAMVRLTLNAGLTDAELDHLEAALGTIARSCQPWNWPIARRSKATMALQPQAHT